MKPTRPMSTVPAARVLSERYSPVSGVPLRVGELWPPRLAIHNVATKGNADEIVQAAADEVTATNVDFGVASVLESLVP